jgi:16S rRNA U1498 N3-methylase RsmE
VEERANADRRKKERWKEKKKEYNEQAAVVVVGSSGGFREKERKNWSRVRSSVLHNGLARALNVT